MVYVAGGGLNCPNLNILDLGCGIGNVAMLFPARCLVTGIDYNPKYIEYANKKFASENRKFIFADAVEYSLNEKNKYDLVCMFDFLHHLDDEHCLEILESSGRLTNKNIVIMDPIDSSENAPVIKLINRFDRGKHIRSNVRMKELIQEAGLTILENPKGNIFLCTKIT
jgi:2-polyprenyl-3-methyl-5-hydroxy-6-metoxy-1,4-benzoquinol methylase